MMVMMMKMMLMNAMMVTTLHLLQGGDVGTQYRSGIYYHSESQRAAALESRGREAGRRAAPVVTELLPAAAFYPAEEYHQQYLQKGGQGAHKGDLSPIRCYG